ncbi:hypothetical protein AB9K41_09985, partial [Cribrihabitans sp. XS_ASV171]
MGIVNFSDAVSRQRRLLKVPASRPRFKGSRYPHAHWLWHAVEGNGGTMVILLKKEAETLKRPSGPYWLGLLRNNTSAGVFQPRHFRVSGHRKRLSC